MDHEHVFIIWIVNLKPFMISKSNYCPPLVCSQAHCLKTPDYFTFVLYLRSLAVSISPVVCRRVIMTMVFSHLIKEWLFAQHFEESKVQPTLVFSKSSVAHLCNYNVYSFFTNPLRNQAMPWGKNCNSSQYL